MGSLNERLADMYKYNLQAINLMAIYKIVSNCLRFTYLISCCGISASLFVNVGYASDGGINSALAEAGCVQESVKRLPPIGTALVYEATCVGTSHTIVRVVCMNGKCIPDHPHGRRDEPGDEVE